MRDNDAEQIVAWLRVMDGSGELVTIEDAILAIEAEEYKRPLTLSPVQVTMLADALRRAER